MTLDPNAGAQVAWADRGHTASTHMFRSLNIPLEGVTRMPELNVFVFALLLNFPWEILQTPLFEHMPDAPHWEAIKTCSRATLGDAAIMLVAYWVVAATRGSRTWIARPQTATVFLFATFGVLATALIERLALAGLWIDSWAYSASMPIVPGIGVGLSPLLQWIVLPLLVVWFVRRQIRTDTFSPAESRSL
jgi:hypothetical protein